MNKLKLSKDESGAVALITVILLMFVFLVVTLGFLRMAVNEQRNSSDSDLNSRAYYAAESGVEDARRIIGQFYADGLISASERTRLNGDNCSRASISGVPDPTLSAELDAYINCQLIDMTPGDFITSLGVNQSVFLPLIPADAGITPDQVASVRIQWHGGDDGAVSDRDASNVDLPEVGCWNTGENTVGVCSGSPYAAMLRTGLFAHPMSGGVGRASMTNKISYLNPVNGAGTITAAAFGVGTPATNRVSNAPKCETTASTDTYFCTLTITNLSTPGNPLVNYLRLTPIYKGATIRVVMLDASGEPIGFKDIQAKIDVTAQAGDVIRRIETRIPLKTLDVLPDEAITTADQLCKKVTITPSPAGGLRGEDECPN